MRIAAIVCLAAALLPACTLQETDQEKNRSTLVAAIQKAANGKVEYLTYRHLIVTTADGTVSESKQAILGVFKSSSFYGKLLVLDNSSDKVKVKSEYDYQVQDGQQYIKEAKSKTWRRPSPGENTPSGDPGMGNLADIVRRAQAIQPYRLTQLSGGGGFYRDFGIKLAPQDVESLLGVSVKDSQEPLFLKSVSSKFDVLTASIDDRLALVEGKLSGTLPANKTKVTLELETQFFSNQLKGRPQDVSRTADPERDRALLASALKAATVEATAFAINGGAASGSGRTDIAATGVMKQGRVSMRYRLGPADEYDMVLADGRIYVRKVGSATWATASADGFTWLLAPVRLDLIAQSVALSSTISSALRVPQVSLDEAAAPPFVQPVVSGLVRDSGPGGSDNEYILTLKPDQMAQLLLSDQDSGTRERFAKSIRGELDVFLYPFGDRLSALSLQLQIDQPKDSAYRATSLEAVYRPATVDDIAIPAGAVPTPVSKILN